MWLVIGLGNPGNDYADTRHNIGFKVIDVLAERLSITINKKARNFTYGRGFTEDQEVILIKPLTFMNKSGVAVMDAIRKYEDIENLLVVHDDLDLDIGIIRIRKTGSSGGHRGVESIINMTGTKDFIRLKIGIGRSNRIPSEEYVLRAFLKKEIPIMEEVVVKAVESIPVIIHKGVSHAQNRLHRTVQ
jgi:PTH1 family peptidyl-tRNA hydrolase